MPHMYGYGNGKKGANPDKIGGHGPVMGIKGLVLKDLMKRMDDKESKKLKGKGRPSRYSANPETPGFERHGR